MMKNKLTLPILALGFSALIAAKADAQIYAEWDFTTSTSATPLTQYADSVDPDNYWTSGFAGSGVTADGVYRIQRNGGFTRVYGGYGSTVTTTPEQAWMVVDVAGWNLPNMTEGFAQNQINFGFTDVVGTANITAEIRLITRSTGDNDPNTLYIDAVTGGSGGVSNTGGDVGLTLTQNVPVQFALGVDSVTSQYSVYFREEGSSWQHVFTDSFTSGRGPVGFVMGHAGEWGDDYFFDVSGISISGTTPIPEPGTYAMIFGAAALALASYRRSRANRTKA